MKIVNSFLWRDRLGTLLTEWERTQEGDEALLRGPLLTEAEKWFDQRSQDLSDQEGKFISASRAKRERLEREEKVRQERELDTVRKFAAEQKRYAELSEKVRRRAVVMSVIAFVAVAALILLVALQFLLPRPPT